MSFKIAYNNFSCIFTIKSLHSFQLVKGSSLGLLWYISCHVFCFYSFANPPSNPCSPQYRAAYLPALQRHCALLRVKFGPFPRPLGPTQSAPCSALILLYAAPSCSHHSSRTGVPSVSWTPLAPSQSPWACSPLLESSTQNLLIDTRLYCSRWHARHFAGRSFLTSQPKVASLSYSLILCFILPWPEMILSVNLLNKKMSHPAPHCCPYT